MHEVPCLERALLAFDDEQALTHEDEEVLLGVLPVVHAVRIAGTQDPDADPDLVETRLLAVEHGEAIAARDLEPAGLTDVHDEPPVRDWPQAMFGSLESDPPEHPQPGLLRGRGKPRPYELPQ